MLHVQSLQSYHLLGHWSRQYSRRKCWRNCVEFLVLGWSCIVVAVPVLVNQPLGPQQWPWRCCSQRIPLQRHGLGLQRLQAHSPVGASSEMGPVTSMLIHPSAFRKCLKIHDCMFCRSWLSNPRAVSSKSGRSLGSGKVRSTHPWFSRMEVKRP